MWPFFVYICTCKKTLKTMNNLVIKRSQIVEAKLAGSLAVGNRYFFQDIPNLSRNNIIVYGIEAFTETELAVAPSGATTVGTSTGIVVTLRDNQKQEFMYQVPYFTLIRANNAGLIVMLKPRIINLTDCYVNLTSTSGLSVNEVACFNLYYDLI
jgi:hypothetical protein